VQPKSSLDPSGAPFPPEASRAKPTLEIKINENTGNKDFK